MDKPSHGVGWDMVKGAFWATSMRLGVRGIGLFSLLILVRLLTPDDFGVVAMASVFYGLLEAMTQFGFDTILIQNQQAERRDYDTVWTMTLLRGLVIASVLAGAAGTAAEFFEDNRIELILYVLAFAAVVESFANPGIVDFRKHFRFHKDFAFALYTKISAFSITISIAIIWQSYWALIAGMLANSIIRVLLSYYMHPYRPRLDLHKWRPILGFAVWLFFNNITAYILNRGDIFIVGKILNSASVGIYTMAMEIINFTSVEFIAPLRRALLPGYSRVSGEIDRLRQIYLDSSAVIIMLLAPVAIGIGLVADPLIRLLLGEAWVASTDLVQILAIYGFFQVSVASSGTVLLAIRKPHYTTIVSMIRIVIAIPAAIWGAVTAGLIGVAWAAVLSTGIGAILYNCAALVLLNVHVAEVASRTWRSFVSLGCMVVTVLWMKGVAIDGSEWISPVLLLLVETGLGAFVYVGCHITLWWLSGKPYSAERWVFNLVKGKLLRRIQET